MSNTDSFIDEVTEEVRRDRNFALLRRYGWIGVALVLVIVGGAAWNEWQKSSARSAAQAFGDAVLAAMDAPDPAGRVAALTALTQGGAASRAEQAALVRLLLASAALDAGDATARDTALGALSAVASDPALTPAWRDLAALRLASAQGSETPAAQRRAALEPLAVPGRPYRTLAQEQLALIAVETGDRDGALTILRALVSDQEAPAGLRRRAGQLIVVLESGVAAG